MDKKIKVALCITELERGGAEKALVQLASGLNPELFEVIIYSLRSKKWHSKHSFLSILASRGIQVKFLNVNSVLSFPKACHRLKRMLREQKPDVFQSFLFHANLLGRFAAKAAGVPLVCSGIRVAEKKAKWHLRLDCLTQHFVDKYICVSESVAHFTRTRGHINAEKIQVITNGIDPDVPFNVEDVMTPLPDDYAKEPAVVYLGRLHYQKGLFWLMDTLPEWLARETSWHLWLFGDGPDREKLETRLLTLPFADRIHLPGRHTNIYDILSGAALLVLPSRWEGMPNVVLEAMTVGIPVLVTDTEGTRELLGNDPRQIVPFGDSLAFCRNITALLNDPELRSKIGNANRDRAIKLFNINDKINAYIDAWNGNDR
ncbi:MAG: glycosyltransferase [Planctomycetia bacterium]|nr:glycosyltransferase [Planctomycetia bacterium]